MKRRWLAVLCLATVAALLTGCQGGQQPTQTFAEVTQYLGPAATNTPIPVNSNLTGVSDGSDAQDDSIFADNPYVVDHAADDIASDALGEEDTQDNGTADLGATVVYGAAEADATVYPYAGSSPIPLDPIDAPSPTPRSALNFTYVPYDVVSLGLSFEAPAGWIPDDTISEMYTLTEPEQQMKDGQLGVINLYAVPVNATYNESALTAEIKQRLSTIGSTNFIEWKPSLTATRFLMGSKGVYANYSGKLANGVQVGGRIHATSIDKVLYCIQITYPLNFKDDYLNIFSKLRETIKRTGR
ncbi:MAG: hypothetical protein GX418_10935 [Clostridiales bacterium]|nr:hypothetical protein [Clostridiales bacterium]